MLFPHYKVLIFDCADQEALKRCQESVENQTLDNVEWTMVERSPKGIQEGLHALQPHQEDVIVFLEGTDWIFSPYILSALHNAYLRHDVMFTSSLYLHHRSRTVGGSKPYPRLVLSRNYRKAEWRCSGLKSCKTKVLNAIRFEDLDPTALESSLTYSILELTGPRIYFFDKVQLVHGAQEKKSWSLPKKTPKHPLL